MDLELTGKVALVTAASKGLGRATATQLAAEGARVMISSRGEEQLAKTASEIAEATGGAGRVLRGRRVRRRRPRAAAAGDRAAPRRASTCW